MPFTPFHMGFGCAVKPVLGRYFSLTVFGFAQVAIDVEPLVRMLRRDTIIHGFSHTYLGATGIGLFSLFVGRPVCQWLLGYWKADGTGIGAWLRGPATISWLAAFTGAFIGTYSHVLLDSVMHSDMQPYAPFGHGNGLLGVMSIDHLHMLCVALGLLGGVGLGALYWFVGRHRKLPGS